ncbi:MAG TPA: PilN domain-containing protein [Anaeromyxobacteraceae bacterium]|nr:PilN domain-containing protein [Anaeromyxobacteraceae bacterium]
MIRINLLPVRVSKKKVAGKQQLLLLGLAAVLALILNWLWSSSRAGDLAGYEAKVRRTRDDIAQLDRIIGEVKNIKAQQAALKEKLDILERLKAGRSGPVRLLDQLAQLVPKKLEFRKMEEKAGVVTFDGSAATIDDVSAFMTALKGTPYFTGIELKKTTAATRGGFHVVDFVIVANANYTPAAPPAPVKG